MCLFVILGVSHFTVVLIVPVPGHCLHLVVVILAHLSRRFIGELIVLFVRGICVT